MTPVELILARLSGAKKSGTGWSARCPAHDDRNASLSVAEGDDDRALLKCHAGCSVEAVVAAMGLDLHDLFPKTDGPIRNGKPKPTARTFPTANDAVAELEHQHGPRSALWTYHDANGNPIGVVVRWDRPDGKDIRPVAKHGDIWKIGAMPAPRPLYGLPNLATAPLVIVCEGEKAAEKARALGFTATTSAGGAQVPGKTDWGPLAGKKVWILPDNDAPGRKYAETVAGILAKLTPAPDVRIVELPGLPPAGDIVDWIEAHGDAAEPDGMRREIEALAGTVEPCRPDEGDDLSFRPFPVEALPEPIQRFVAEGAKAIGCDPSYLALPMLTTCAAAIDTTRCLELKRSWSAPAILWGAIVGESGTAKTPAFKLVMRPFRERQRKALERHTALMKQYEADLARWEKEMVVWKRPNSAANDPPQKPLAPPAERFIVSDATVEALAPILLANPRGLLMARDEFAAWIGSFDRYAGKSSGGTDAANWLSMFNAESVIVDRKTGNQQTIHVPQAAVSVTGGIQPEILRRALGSEHRESGMAARLLLAYPPRKPKKWSQAEINREVEAEVARLVDRLYDLQPAQDGDRVDQPVLVRLTPEAMAAWVNYYNGHAQEQNELTGDLSAAWSKLEEYAARLALVVHFIRWAANDPNLNPDMVDATSMEAAITLVNWFKHEARRVYAMLEESAEEAGQRRLVDWIGRNGGTVSAREVQQGCRWLKDAWVAEAALEELVKAGRGTWSEIATTLKGGRPTREFSLSTPSAVYESPAIPVENGGCVGVDSADIPSPDVSDAQAPKGLFRVGMPAGPYRERY